MAAAVPFIAAAIGGLVVSKVVGKITGSPLLGAIAGGFAGFGIGSMISSSAAAGSGMVGADALSAAGGTTMNVVPATVSGGSGGFADAFSSAFTAGGQGSMLANVGGLSGTGGSVAGVGGAAGSGFIGADALASAGGTTMSVVPGGAATGGAATAGTVNPGIAPGGTVFGSAPPVVSSGVAGTGAVGVNNSGGGIIDKILGSMEKYPAITKVGADFVGGLFETNKSEEYFDAKSEYEKEQRELRSADDKIEGANVAMSADGIFPEGAVGKQMQLMNRRTGYRGQNRVSPLQKVLPEGELMQNYATRKPKVTNSNEEEEKA